MGFCFLAISNEVLLSEKITDQSHQSGSNCFPNKWSIAEWYLRQLVQIQNQPFKSQEVKKSGQSQRQTSWAINNKQAISYQLGRKQDKKQSQNLIHIWAVLILFKRVVPKGLDHMLSVICMCVCTKVVPTRGGLGPLWVQNGQGWSVIIPDHFCKSGPNPTPPPVGTTFWKSCQIAISCFSPKFRPFCAVLSVLLLLEKFICLSNQ